MLVKLRPQDFDNFYKLLVTSFPSDEYRSYEDQKALLDNPEYTIFTFYTFEQDIMAFSAVWEFPEFVFIEHFAVNPAYRNKGIGTKVLNELLESKDLIFCLEVELPTEEISARRIEFYKRNNFFLNLYPYVQPSMAHAKKPIPLYIMTSGGEVDMPTFNKIKNILYAKVYLK